MGNSASDDLVAAGNARISTGAKSGVTDCPQLQMRMAAVRANPADSDDEEVEQSDEEPGSSGGLPIKLSSTRRADVSEFKGKTFINIREYYEVQCGCLVTCQPFH